MTDKKAIMEELSAAINRWLQGRKNRSLAMLAHRTNKAYSTIRYIAQGERLANESTILAITDVIMMPWEKVKFFKRYFPHLGEMMEKAYAPDLKEEEEQHELLRYFISREPHNRIFNMAASSHGTYRSTIRRLLGDVGESALQEMLNEGFLYKTEEGRIRYHNPSWTTTDVDETLTQIRASLEHFDRDLVGTDASALLNMTASIRREEIPRLKQLISRFVQELAQLKNHPDAEGDVPFFCNLIYSIYDKNQWLLEDEQGQTASEDLRNQREENDENSRYRSVTKSDQVLAHDVQQPQAMTLNMLESIRNSSSSREACSLANTSFHDKKSTIKSDVSQTKDIMQAPLPSMCSELNEMAHSSVVEACVPKPISSEKFLKTLYKASELRENRIQEDFVKTGKLSLNKVIVIEDDEFFQRVWRREFDKEKLTIFKNFSEFYAAMPNLSQVDFIVTDDHYDNGESVESLIKWAKLEKVSTPIFLYSNSETRQEDSSFFAASYPKSSDSIKTFKRMISSLDFK